MRLHLHPTRQEALTATHTTLTRWSLATTPAKRLALFSTAPFTVFYEKYDPDGRLGMFGGVTRAPDGRVFAHPRLSAELYNPPCEIEVRRWEDLSLDKTITVPQTQGWVEDVDVSPDGRWLILSPLWPRRVYLLDWQSGKVISHHAVLGNATTGLSFDSTSTYVAGCSSHDGGGWLMLWRIDPAERFVSSPEMEQWRQRDDQINGPVVLTLIHPGLDRTGIEWPHGTELNDTHATSLFSPDGRMVVFKLFSGDSPTLLELVAYEVPSGRRLWCVRSDIDCSGEATFSPDGRLLILPERGGDLLMYRVEDGSLDQRMPPGLSEPVEALAFDHDGRTLWMATNEALDGYSK